MADFERAMERLLALEGGFAARDNTAGAVNFGITQRFLRLIGRPASIEDVRALRREQAIELYKEYFWDRQRIGEIDHQRLAEAYFLASVNMGPRAASLALQQSLGALRGALVVDGVVGQQTIRALNALTPQEAETVLEGYLRRLRMHYEQLARANPAEYADDLAGWKARLGEEL